MHVIIFVACVGVVHVVIDVAVLVMVVEDTVFIEFSIMTDATGA